MNRVKVIYGSSTGNTENAAKQIAAAFETHPVDIAAAKEDDFDAELLILGSSTWGYGELADEWETGKILLENAVLKDRKVAVFGTGNQVGFSDTFCDAVGILADIAEARGANMIGQTPAECYTFSASKAESGGMFKGLLLDEDNEPEKTPERIASWVEELKNSCLFLKTELV